jgi:hypothetical protein
MYTYLTTRTLFDHRHSVFHFGQGILTRLAIDAKLEGGEKQLVEVESIDELHDWLSGPFIRGAFDASMEQRNSSIIQGGHFIGGIRIAQLRAKGEDCWLRPGSWNLGGDFQCYNKGQADNFLTDYEDTQDFSLFTSSTSPRESPPIPFRFDGIDGDSGAPLDYENVDFTRSFSVLSTYRSQESVVYPSPAFAVVLSPTLGEERAREIVADLKGANYIDMQTKAFFVDLNVYNPTIKRLCLVRLLAELDDSGRVIASYDFSSVPIESRPWDEFVLTILVAAIYAWYAFKESSQMYEDGWAYWSSGLNLLEVCNICAFFAALCLKAVAQSYVPENIDPASNQFYNLTIPVRLTLMATSLEACAVICNWFKIIPILSLSKTFMVMVKTIAKAGRQVGGFFIIFMIIMYGFTQAFTMVYGYRLYQYQTMEKSFFTLLKSLLGDFNFDELRDANPYVGPVLFVTFIGLAVFVLLNMLIAIISDAYAEAVKEIEIEKDIAVLTLIFQYLRELAHSIPVVGKFFVRGEEIAKNIAKKIFIDGEDEMGGDLRALDAQIESAEGEKSTAVENEDYELATSLKQRLLELRAVRREALGRAEGLAEADMTGMAAASKGMAAASNKFKKQMTQRQLTKGVDTFKKHRRTTFLGSSAHQLEHLVRPNKKGLRSLQNKILHGKTPKNSSNGRHGRHGEGGASSSSAVDVSKFETMVAATLDSKLEQFKTDLLASLQSGGGQSSGGEWEAQLSPLPKVPPPVHHTIPPPPMIGPTHMTDV